MSSTPAPADLSQEIYAELRLLRDEAKVAQAKQADFQSKLLLLIGIITVIVALRSFGIEGLVAASLVYIVGCFGGWLDTLGAKPPDWLSPGQNDKPRSHLYGRLARGLKPRSPQPPIFNS